MNFVLEFWLVAKKKIMFYMFKEKVSVRGRAKEKEGKKKGE